MLSRLLGCLSIELGRGLAKLPRPAVGFYWYSLLSCLGRSANSSVIFASAMLQSSCLSCTCQEDRPFDMHLPFDSCQICSTSSIVLLCNVGEYDPHLKVQIGFQFRL